MDNFQEICYCSSVITTQASHWYIYILLSMKSKWQRTRYDFPVPIICILPLISEQEFNINGHWEQGFMLSFHTKSQLRRVISSGPSLYTFRSLLLSTWKQPLRVFSLQLVSPWSVIGFHVLYRVRCSEQMFYSAKYTAKVSNLLRQ